MLQRVSKVINSLFVSSKDMSEIKIIRKPRYDGRVKKRSWEERRTDKGEGLGALTKKIKKEETEITKELIEKIKRRKFAILLGYSGAEYYGMQRNPYTRTIEEELFKALLKNNYITQIMFEQVQTFSFQRAARTDKGVSAIRQVVSCKLPENFDVDKLNNDLPDVIRVFGSKRVTKGFNSKTHCDSRTYCYVLPTVSFLPAGQMMQQRGYRISEDIHKYVNEILAKYVGTKNFHNFTSKKKPLDPSAKRFMKSFVANTPFVKDNVEFTVLKVQGQSFMLHQIRKMVGLTIAVVKGFTDEKTLEAAFTTEKIAVPRAPGLGLMLDYVHYDRYNERYGKDGVHETLTWDEVEDTVREFKEKYIWPKILDTEIKEECMVNWIIKKLSGHTYDGENKDDDEEEENKSNDDDDDDCGGEQENDKSDDTDEKKEKAAVRS